MMSPYLNFDGTTLEAFTFYKSVFGGEFSELNVMTDAPGTEHLPEEEKRRIMHISLPIDAHTILMGSDILPSAGHVLVMGNNINLSLHPSSKEEADRLFNGLSEGGTVEMPIQDTYWGAYFGNFKDKFGINWSVNYQYPEVKG
jgi:PhnB protein